MASMNAAGPTLKTSVVRWIVLLAPMALTGVYIALAWSPSMAMAFEAMGLMSLALASLVIRRGWGRLASGVLVVLLIGFLLVALERADYEAAVLGSGVPLGCSVAWLAATKNGRGQLRRELWMLGFLGGGIVAVNLGGWTGLGVVVVSMVAVGGGLLLRRRLRGSHRPEDLPAIRFPISPSLLTLLRERRDRQRAERVQEEVEQEYDAFLLDPGLGPMTFLVADGRILVDGTGWDDEGIRFETSPDRAVGALVVGAKKTGIQGLLALIPRLEAGSTCPRCRGTRWMTLAGEKPFEIICLACFGRGEVDERLVAQAKANGSWVEE